MKVKDVDNAVLQSDDSLYKADCIGLMEKYNVLCNPVGGKTETFLKCYNSPKDDNKLAVLGTSEAIAIPALYFCALRIC